MVNPIQSSDIPVKQSKASFTKVTIIYLNMFTRLNSIPFKNIYFCNLCKYFDYLYHKQMFMSISERLQMVIKMNGMTNASFADEIGVQRSSISHVLAGRNKPSIDFIQKILLAFPKVNADWLVTGKKIGRTIEQAEPAESQEHKTFKTPEIPTGQDIQEEDPIEYKGRKSEVTEEKTVDGREARITKIIIFYDDGSFEETVPKH